MAKQKSYVLGRDAVAYYSTTGKLIGDVGTGEIQALIAAWLGDDETAHATNMTSVSYDIGSQFADATTRESAKEGFASNIPVLRNGQITFEMRWLPAAIQGAGTDYTSRLVNAWQNDSPIAMVFLDWDLFLTPPDGTTIFPQGMAANWSVSLSKTEDLNDVQRGSITLTVADKAAWFFATAAAATPSP